MEFYCHLHSLIKDANEKINVQPTITQSVVFRQLFPVSFNSGEVRINIIFFRNRDVFNLYPSGYSICYFIVNHIAFIAFDE